MKNQIDKSALIFSITIDGKNGARSSVWDDLRMQLFALLSAQAADL